MGTSDYIKRTNEASPGAIGHMRVQGKSLESSMQSYGKYDCIHSPKNVSPFFETTRGNTGKANIWFLSLLSSSNTFLTKKWKSEEKLFWGGYTSFTDKKIQCRSVGRVSGNPTFFFSRPNVTNMNNLQLNSMLKQNFSSFNWHNTLFRS